jgi:hypothetical protein
MPDHRQQVTVGQLTDRRLGVGVDLGRLADDAPADEGVPVRDVTATGLNPKPRIVLSRNRVALLGGGSSA